MSSIIRGMPLPVKWRQLNHLRRMI
jgi:hypothetical protein